MSGPIDLVAIDLDGTLLRSDRQLSPAVVQAVRRAVVQGVRVVLASARPPRSVRAIYDLLGLTTLQINYNGALICDPVTGRCVRHTPLDPPLARQVVTHARELDADVLVSLEVLDRWYTDRHDHLLGTETSRHFQPDYLGPLDQALDQPVTKLMLLAPPARLEPLARAVENRFARAVGLVVSDPHLLQVTHPAVDKAAALAEVCAFYGVARARVMAIGDAPNDVPMLRWAGLGVAVENAWPQARQAAHALAPANDADGVAWALHKWVLR